MNASMDVEAEIRDPKRRIDEPEGSFGFLMEQVKGVHRSVLGFQAETKEQFRKVDERLDRVEGKLGRVEKDVKYLRDEMPGIVGDAMREVLRERDGR
jgi:hypothetical protein